ncbi:phage tail tube protein, partial [Microbacterium sp. Bi128]|uniref:phage tail tube protein n=1 Tax=Microbacterium sp. Bi128 TaxID=2821115 RepID=UPI001E582A16
MTQLDFSLGIAQETVYGTAVTPTRFPESDAQIKYEISTVDGRGLRPSKGVKRLARNTVSKFEGKGSISLDVGTRGFGMLLNAVMGNVVNTALPSGTPVVYQQLHTLSQSDALTKSFTVQELLPTVGADDLWPHTFTGVVFESMEISAKEGGILEAVFEVVARALSTVEPASTPSYPTGDSLFTFLHGAVKIATNPMSTAPS